MTTKAAFSPSEWQIIREAPPSAGMIVVTASRGGMIRESMAMSKAYVEARAQHGESQLLDDLVSDKPELDHSRYHSAAELRASGLDHIRQAVFLLEGKASAEEVEGYRGFVLRLASRVAQAHRENGAEVSPAEAEAIEEIAGALGASPHAAGPPQ